MTPLEKFMSENRVWKERVELWSWTPARCHAKNRVPTVPVVGVTNRDALDSMYYAIAEIDQKISLEQVFNRCRNVGLIIAMVFETAKGYHFYFANRCKNPNIVIKLLKSAKVFDGGHLSLHKTRDDKTLVLRVSRKYPEPDIIPVYINIESMTDWHREVLQAILYFCWRKYECKFMTLLESALGGVVRG